MTPDLETGWRKSSRSGGEGGNCPELKADGSIRDSKDPGGHVLRVPLPEFLVAVKEGRLDR